MPTGGHVLLLMWAHNWPGRDRHIAGITDADARLALGMCFSFIGVTLTVYFFCLKDVHVISRN